MSINHNSWLIPPSGASIDQIPTPALIIDLKGLETNLQVMADYFSGHTTRLRPHFKTHKSIHIAQMQIERGAIGITCAKLGEAECLVGAGIARIGSPESILIANQVVGPLKTRRLAELAREARLLVAVDNEDNLCQIAQAACQRGSQIGVLVEVDVGLHRCGVRSVEQAVELARLASGLEGVRFEGVMGYEGHTVFEIDRARREANVRQAMGLLTEIAGGIRQAGMSVNIVSAGGTGTFDLTGSYPGITEIQAGSYPFMDSKYQRLDLPFQPALSLLATVISVPSPTLAILDCGMKALTTDNGLPEVLQPAGVRLLRLNEEHSILEVDPAQTHLQVGKRVELLPSHVCTTVNLHDRYYVLRDGILEAVWGIEGRGKVQ